MRRDRHTRLLTMNLIPHQAPVTRKRLRISKRKAVIPPSNSQLGGCLKFTNVAQKKRFTNISSRVITNGRYFEKSTLEKLHILNDVHEYLQIIGWDVFWEFNYSTFVELTYEFYTTISFIIPEKFTCDTPRVVNFWLMNKMFHLSLNEFIAALKFLTGDISKDSELKTSFCDYSDEFKRSMYNSWGDMSVDWLRYHYSRSKSSNLKDHALQIIQRFLVFMFSGRSDTYAVCSKSEFFFLWSMFRHRKVNLGYWVATQFDLVVNNESRSLVLGSLITMLAVNLGVLDLSNHNMHISGEVTPLDMKCLTKLGLVKYNGEHYVLSPPGLYERPAHVYTVAGTNRPSTSQPASSTSHTSSEARLAKIETVVAAIDRRTIRMKSMLMTYLEKLNLQPPPS